MRKLLAVIAALSLPVSVCAMPGYYLQGNIGGVSTYDDANLLGSTDGVGAGLDVGYLWGNNNFNYGFEAGSLFYPHLVDKGSEGDLFDDYKVVVDGYNLDLLGVLKYTFNWGFNVFVKAGAAYVHQKNTISSLDYPAPDVTHSNDNVGPEIAGGIGYQFTPNLGINLTADETFNSKGLEEGVEVSSTTSLLAGIIYNFG